MLRVAIILGLAVACLGQTRPKFAETFSSSGGYEYHDNRGETFFGQFVIDRDQSTKMGVENATYKVDNLTERYERLERYDMGEIFTIRDNGKGDVHCQLEKKSGNLPEFWGWLANAQYTGNVTYHEVVYNEWSFHAGSVDLRVLVLPTNVNTPKFYESKTGPNILGFEFKSYQATTPPSRDFNIPPECT